MRHGLIRDFDPAAGIAISTLAYDYPAGFAVHEHAHGAGQVIYAISGVMEVSADRSVWLIPPQFAIWIPARTTHRIRMPEAVAMRTLYLRPGVTRRLPQSCTVLHVSGLLRELIVAAVQIGQLRTDRRTDRAMSDLIVHLLREASPVPIFVTLPHDPRALAVAQATLADAGTGRSMPDLCGEAGASVRTIQRLFRREVGVGFERWRQQARLMKGVELLVNGCSVKKAAYEVGYQQPSAFVDMFRKTMGTTPKAWTAALASASPTSIRRFTPRVRATRHIRERAMRRTPRF